MSNLEPTPKTEEAPRGVLKYVKLGHAGIAISQEGRAIVDHTNSQQVSFWVRLDAVSQEVFEGAPPDEVYEQLYQFLSPLVKAAVDYHKGIMEPPYPYDLQSADEGGY